MANKNSSLMSWMKSLFSNKTSDSDLIRWAQTEYGSNWKIAYQQMKLVPNQLPRVGGVYH
jgi:hypothetical protein